MSAAVCGSKRSFFKEIPSPSVSKRIRCSSPSTSPVRLSHPAAPLDRLRAIFPHMEDQVLERVLEDCGNNLDDAIKSLQNLCLTSTETNLANDVAAAAEVQAGFPDNENANDASENSGASEKLPSSGAEWVEFLVNEMTTATSIDDAKTRVTRVLEILEKTISARAGEEAAKSFQQENMMLKEQIQILIKDNSLLKRAVALQHERQKDYGDMNREIEHLKQVVSQYQEQVRNLEVNNYALRMHLRQAQDGSSIPGRFHPDIF